MGHRRRLDVSRALVGGSWVAGDVWIDADGRVDAVGVAPSGSAVRQAVPGFVDLQCNGAGGVDFATADEADYATAGAALRAAGTVAVTPTLFSLPADGYVSALAALGRVRSEPVGSDRHAAVDWLGAHLEGPFLSPQWAGAHDPSRLLDPDVEVVRRLLDAGPVARMTVAPELVGCAPVIVAVRAAGVHVSIGHSDATAERTRDAIDLGVQSITHCFNAHRRFTAREPGPAGVALTDDRMLVTFIADGHHLAAEAVAMILAAAPQRCAVVSDAVGAARTAASTWQVGGVDCAVVGTRVERLDGTLAGSASLLDASLRSLLDLGVAEELAVAAVATTPGRAAGLGPHDLSPGSVARAVVCSDRWDVCD